MYQKSKSNNSILLQGRAQVQTEASKTNKYNQSSIIFNPKQPLVHKSSSKTPNKSPKSFKIPILQASKTTSSLKKNNLMQSQFCQNIKSMTKPNPSTASLASNASNASLAPSSHLPSNSFSLPHSTKQNSLLNSRNKTLLLTDKKNKNQSVSVISVASNATVNQNGNFNSSTVYEEPFSDRKILSTIKSKEKNNLSKLFILQNRVRVMKKQEEENQRLISRYNYMQKKTELAKEYKKNILNELNEAKLREDIDKKIKKKKAKWRKKFENLSSEKIMIQKNIVISNKCENFKNVKNANQLILNDTTRSILNSNVNKKNKVQTDILQMKMKNYNKNLQIQISRNNELNLMIMQGEHMNKVLENQITLFEQEEDKCISQLRKTISRKTALKNRLFSSIEMGRNVNLNTNSINSFVNNGDANKKNSIRRIGNGKNGKECTGSLVKSSSCCIKK